MSPILLGAASSFGEAVWRFGITYLPDWLFRVLSSAWRFVYGIGDALWGNDWRVWSFMGVVALAGVLSRRSRGGGGGFRPVNEFSDEMNFSGIEFSEDDEGGMPMGFGISIEDMMSDEDDYEFSDDNF